MVIAKNKHLVIVVKPQNYHCTYLCLSDGGNYNATFSVLHGLLRLCITLCLAIRALNSEIKEAT